MPRAGLESDALYVRIYDMNTKEYIQPGKEQKDFKPQIADYTWFNANENIFILVYKL